MQRQVGKIRVVEEQIIVEHQVLFRLTRQQRLVDASLARLHSTRSDDVTAQKLRRFLMVHADHNLYEREIHAAKRRARRQ